MNKKKVLVSLLSLFISTSLILSTSLNVSAKKKMSKCEIKQKSEKILKDAGADISLSQLLANNSTSNLNYLKDLCNSKQVIVTNSYYKITDNIATPQKITDAAVETSKLSSVNSESEFKKLYKTDDDLKKLDQITSPLSTSNIQSRIAVDAGHSNILSTTTAKTSYVKFTMVLVKLTGQKNLYNVTYSAVWLKSPVTTSKDIVGLTWNNNTSGEFNTFSCTLYANCNKQKVNSSNYTTTTVSEKITTRKTASSSGIAYTVDLYSNHVSGNYSYVYSNQRIIITGNITLDSSSNTTIQLFGQYFHKLYSPSPNVSVSFSGPSLSLGILSFTYDELQNNAIIKYKAKYSE